MTLQSSKKSILPKINKINYESILNVLNEFHTLYSWDKTEKKLSNKNSLKHYAVLINKWINGFSLSQIIKQSIDWSHARNKIDVSFGKYETFDKNNKKHVNRLIENIIDEIEYVLRFLLEKYFNHYHQILLNILGEEKAGENWATLLEYGTQNPLIIALQNIGISRNTSLKIFKNHRSALYIENKKLIGVNKELLLKSMKTDSMEFDEIRRNL